MNVLNAYYADIAKSTAILSNLNIQRKEAKNIFNSLRVEKDKDLLVSYPKSSLVSMSSTDSTSSTSLQPVLNLLQTHVNVLSQQLEALQTNQGQILSGLDALRADVEARSDYNAQCTAKVATMLATLTDTLKATLLAAPVSAPTIVAPAPSTTTNTTPSILSTVLSVLSPTTSTDTTSTPSTSSDSTSTVVAPTTSTDSSTSSTGTTTASASSRFWTKRGNKHHARPQITESDAAAQ